MHFFYLYTFFVNSFLKNKPLTVLQMMMQFERQNKNDNLSYRYRKNQCIKPAIS